MSETFKLADKAKLRRRGRSSEADDLRVWLATLGAAHAPNVHINGISHPSAVVVVDFGTPLTDPVKLTPEQTAELISQVRSATKMLYRDRDVSVRVQSDPSAGVWWSSVG